TTVLTAAPAAPAFVRLRAMPRHLVAVMFAGLCRNPGTAALAGHRCRRSRPVRAAHSAQLLLPFSRGLLPRLIVTAVTRQLSPRPVEVDLQGRDPGSEIRLGKLQLTALLLELRVPLLFSGSLFGLLYPAQR